MKLFLLVDCESRYIFNGTPYIEKEIGTPALTKELDVKIVLKNCL